MLLAVNVLIPYKNTMAMHVWAGDSERKHLLNDIDIIWTYVTCSKEMSRMSKKKNWVSHTIGKMY